MCTQPPKRPGSPMSGEPLRPKDLIPIIFTLDSEKAKVRELFFSAEDTSKLLVLVLVLVLALVLVLVLALALALVLVLVLALVLVLVLALVLSLLTRATIGAQ